MESKLRRSVASHHQLFVDTRTEMSAMKARRQGSADSRNLFTLVRTNSVLQAVTERPKRFFLRQAAFGTQVNWKNFCKVSTMAALLLAGANSGAQELRVGLPQVEIGSIS